MISPSDMKDKKIIGYSKGINAPGGNYVVLVGDYIDIGSTRWWLKAIGNPWIDRATDKAVMELWYSYTDEKDNTELMIQRIPYENIELYYAWDRDDIEGDTE
jgi:hypothetical protein